MLEITRSSSGRLSLSKLIRKIDDCLDSYYQNTYKTPEVLLKDMVDSLNSLLIGRCSSVLCGGKNKGRRCLRRSTEIKGSGVKCGTHNRRTKRQTNSPATLEKYITKETFLNKQIYNQVSAIGDIADQVDHANIDWGEYATPASKPPLQEYYKNPNVELQHLYGKMYVDLTNTVVLENCHTVQDHKWILVCKFNQDKKVLKAFSKTIFAELVKQKTINNYDYVVDDSNQVDESRIVQAIANRSLGKASLKEQPPASTLLLQSPINKLNSFIITNKSKYYNKYSRAPKIKLDDEGNPFEVGREPLMTADEFAKCRFAK